MNPWGILLFQSLWILLPGGVANTIPPIVAKLFPKWNYPMDFGLTLRGFRIFGDHKTFRGLMFGVGGAVITSFILSYLRNKYFSDMPLIDYSVNTFWFGLASGFGALAGDALKSFVKRQAGIPPGMSWFPLDQIDWILGVCLVYRIFFEMPFILFITVLTLGAILHILLRLLGYVFGIVKEAI